MGACDSTPESTPAHKPRARAHGCCPHGPTGTKVPEVTSPHGQYAWIKAEMTRNNWDPLVALGKRTTKHNRSRDQDLLIPLLSWNVVGYSMGRIMDKSRDEYLIDLKHKLIDLSEQKLTKEEYDNVRYNLRLEDKLATTDIYQSWFIYVQIREPETGESKYIKLVLGANVSTIRGIYYCPRGVQNCREMLSKNGTSQMQEYLDKQLRIQDVDPCALVIEIDDNFNYEEANSGCEIIDLSKPDAADGKERSTPTLYDVVKQAYFGQPRPIYTNPEIIGDGELPINNCITFVMRVVAELGVELNPAGWSFLNKKRGRVFLISELENGSFVRLDDKEEAVFKIHNDGNTISAVRVNAPIPEDGELLEVAKIPLTIFEHGDKSYVKEVWKICDESGKSLRNDIGPRKKGYQRLTFWAEIQHSSHLFATEGSRISVRGKLHPDNLEDDVTTYGNWNRIPHFVGDSRELQYEDGTVMNWINSTVHYLTDEEYKNGSEDGRLLEKLFGNRRRGLRRPRRFRRTEKKSEK